MNEVKWRHNTGFVYVTPNWSLLLLQYIISLKIFGIRYIARFAYNTS